MNDKKLEKTARKATEGLRTMLERAIEIRDAIDDAIVSGRLSGETLSAAAAPLDALRAALAELGAFLARLETAAGPQEQAQMFISDPQIGDRAAEAFERCASLAVPPAPDRTHQVLVLKAKKGEWAEVEVPLDAEAFERAVSSAEWRGKAGRALVGTRERLSHLKQRGEEEAATRDLEQALDRLEAALSAEEQRESLRREANARDAARELRLKWVELGFFARAESYLAADAGALGGLSAQLDALSALPGGPQIRARAAELVDGWRARHAAERRALDQALLGSVYDYSVANESLEGLPDYPRQLQALLEAAAGEDGPPPAAA